MTRNSNFILSFSILQTGESVMSAEDNRAIAIVNGSESYETIKEAFGSIFQEINSIVSSGKLSMNDKEINVDFFLGWDYKFILLMLGLKGALQIMHVLGARYTKRIIGKLRKTILTTLSHPFSRSLGPPHKMFHFQSPSLL